MGFKLKGTITKFCELRTTQNGVAIQQIFFKREDTGDYIFPSAIGKNVDQLFLFKQGDKAEIEFDIRGSAEKFNNVVILTATKIR